MKKRIALIISLLVLTLGITSIASAQTGITYGSVTGGEINATAPQGFFTFNGSAGDLITAYVLPTAGDLSPTVALLGPTGQLAFSSSDPFTALANDASVSYRLPAGGAYTLIVGATSGTGTYILALQNEAPSVATALQPGQPVTINIPLGAPDVVYNFTGTPDSPSVITITSLTLDFHFTAMVRDSNGRVVAVIADAVDQAILYITGSNAAYELVVSSADPEIDGTVEISVNLAQIEATSGGSVPPAPAVTEEPISQAPQGVCSVTPESGVVNLRGGPSTDYNVVGQLQPNTFMVVTGQNGGWYVGTYNGVTAWVAGFVVRINGPCDNLPTAAAPALPTLPPPATTEEPGTQPTQDTGGNQGGNQGGTQPTTTPPPPPTEAAQTAPPDTDQHNWTLNRDSGGQFSEVVSYPGGDTSDRIRVTVDGLSNQPPNNFRTFNITLVCNGPGSENLRWGTGGPNSPTGLSCGGSININHTNDSNQTFINVRIDSGGTSYVNYTLIATRIP